jgi:hypothetical protein
LILYNICYIIYLFTLSIEYFDAEVLVRVDYPNFCIEYAGGQADCLQKISMKGEK